MSDRFPSFSPIWYQSNARVQDTVDRHWDRLKEVDIKLLLPYIRARLLLTWDEENSLCQCHWDQHQCIKQLVAFVRQKGWHGMEAFTQCLRESGEKGPHSGHSELAALLHKDLHAKPEELENEQKFKRWRKQCYAERTASIQRELQSRHTQRKLDFEVFKKFVAECTSDYKHGRRILKAKTVNKIFLELSAGKYISQHNTDLLEEILSVFGGPELQEEREKLANFEQQRDFVEFSLKVADTVRDRCTIDDLKICILSTPNCFGSYYSKLEDETKVYDAMCMLSDWENPRLLQRVVRHYCPQYRDWIESYSQRHTPSEHAPELPAHELLEHQEKFADLLLTVVRDLNSSSNFLANPLSVALSEAYPELQLAPFKEHTASGALLALIPFCGYQNLYLLSELVQKYCSSTTAKELDTYATQWNNFAATTTISAIYDYQLDELPLRLSAREVSTVTLHLWGEDWKDPTLSQTSQLAQFLVDSLKLKRWSVIPYRTILTGDETDAKGYCKVELLMPTMAACILIKEGASEVRSLIEKFQEKTISYIEVAAKDKYYFSCTPESLADMHKQASQHTNLAPYFELLRTLPLPHQTEGKAFLRRRKTTQPQRSCPQTASRAKHSRSRTQSRAKQSRSRTQTYRSRAKQSRSRTQTYRSRAKQSRSRTQTYRSRAKQSRSRTQTYRSCAKHSRFHTQTFTSYAQPYQSCPTSPRSRRQHSNNVQQREKLLQ